MDGKYKDFALRELTTLCLVIVTNERSLKTDDHILLLANQLTGAKLASELVEEWNELEGDAESIRDLADSLGVSIGD